jgi:mono/diheme cytochrome c family protein
MSLARTSQLAQSALLVTLAWAALPDMAIAAGKADEIKRGRYLVETSGCNDCHTPGYAQNNGKVDEKLWLTGDKLGWAGPWGTTYPTNLRLLIAGYDSEAVAHPCANDGAAPSHAVVQCAAP